MGKADGNEKEPVKKETGYRLYYKFRIFPTPEQKQYFAHNFGCVRFVYNHFLEARIKAYKATKPTLSDGSPNPSYDPAAKPLNFYETSRMLTQLKKETVDEDGHHWLYDADAQALVYALRNLDRAYNNFYLRVKKGEKPGFPKFKSQKSRQSFTVGTCKVDREGFAVKLPKVGWVDADIHRDVKGKIVAATITKDPDGKYYVSINVKEAEFDPLPESDSAIGVAMGVRKWAVTSDGQVFDNPHVAKGLAEKLAKEQRKLASKQEGSANYEKQRLKVAHIYKKMVNKRAYETHGLTRQLVNENGFIATREMLSSETLQGKTASSKAGKKLPKTAQASINRAIADANFYEINQQLTYKAKWAGREHVVVPHDFPTAQVCGSCGYKYAELSGDLRDTWECPECKAVNDRMYNGAKNVLEAGLDILHEREDAYVTKRTKEGRNEREQKRPKTDGRANPSD